MQFHKYQVGRKDFLPFCLAVQLHAEIQFRRLNADRREEAIAETVAAACVNFQLAAALQGKLNVVYPSFSLEILPCGTLEPEGMLAARRTQPKMRCRLRVTDGTAVLVRPLL